MKTYKQFFKFLVFVPLLMPAVIRSQDNFKVLNNRFSEYKSNAPKERVYVITDRNVYSPGELIWFDATMYDIFTPNISTQSQQLTIRFFDQLNTKLFHKTFAIEEGKAKGFLQLPEGIRDGIYYLSSETEISQGVDYYFHKIIVKNKIVPQFIIEGTFEQKEYIPGDMVALNLSFKDFYNEPKRNVEYQVDFFDGDIKIPGELGKLKKEGSVVINVKIPQNLKSGLFTYQVSAKTKSEDVSLTGKVPVLSDKIFLDFYPESGNIINGISTRVNFFSYDASGLPISIEGDLLEGGEVIKTIRSDQSGLGSFEFDPNDQKVYTVQLKRPLLLDVQYNLPDIVAKGVVLYVQEKSSSMIKYKLVSSYIDPRYVILAGVSGGEIIWVSEHEIDKELEVEVDLSKANDKIAHFIVINAAAKIEGEHMVTIPWEPLPALKVTKATLSPSQRGKVEYIIEPGSAIAGQLIFTAVNEPWIVEDLGCQPINTLFLPFDIQNGLVFQTKGFQSGNFDFARTEKYLKYYIPYGFGWDRILNTQGAFQQKQINDLVTNNRIICDRILVSTREEIAGGKITQVNLITDNNFPASNPHYVSKLYTVKKERVPAYKELLKNGTPLMDVIMTIKPYNLQGNKIVFFGSNNSLLFQDGAIIVVEGINRGSDASIINNINPWDVEKIFISTNPSDIQRYTALNSVGLIEIELKKGGGIQEEPTQKVDEGTEFTAPEYANERSGQIEDIRKTLYWNVQSINSESGSATITYFNSDLISGVKGRVIFIPNNGQPSATQFAYAIK